MNVIRTAIPDVVIFEPKVFGDSRGFFLESFNRRAFEEAVDSAIEFVQDNHSRSKRGVLRGLHYQIQNPQGKLVRVAKGAAFDVAVDIRRSSSTYGKWVGVELNEHNFRQLWVPAGFAHGFLTLEDDTDFLYKTTNYYAPGSERTIRWDDAELGIEWPTEGLNVTLSEKDAIASHFSQAEVFN